MVHAKSVHTECEDAADDLVALVVEEYFQRLKRGEQPRLEEFVEKYPAISDLLRTVIPGLQAAEQSPDVSADGKVSHERHKQLGDFRILRQIGRGGMGIVYEAEQISMNRRVALKVLPLAGLVDELKIRRFQNEVRAVAALNHANIVPVFFVGEERGVYYYAMQLIRGRSLSDVISSLRHVRDEGKEFDGSSISQVTSLGSFDDSAEAEEVTQAGLGAAMESVEADADREVGAETAGISKADNSTIPHLSRREYFRSVAALGIQAASALQHAHDEGVIHRDIKPANLLLDRSAKLYLTDFGLARIEADAGVTMTGDLIGTLRYMAPEQALAKRVVVDHRADIYSLAATLYELLALRPAYLTEDRQQLLKQIAFEEPTPLRRIDGDIPAELETIVHKAMSKDMDQRYSSAQELADDLRSHLDNRPIKAKPPTTSEIIGKWTRRNPILTWSAIITLSLVTMTLAVSTLLISNQRNIAREAERTARQAAETRRQELYAAQVSLAHQAWLDGDLTRAQTLLAAQRPESNKTDLRGFEWRYLWQMCQDESQRTLRMYSGDTTPLVSFSADGGKLAFAEEKTISVSDFASRRELLTFDTAAKRIRALVSSPIDPDLLASGDVDGMIMLWNLTTRAAPSILAKETSVESQDPLVGWAKGVNSLAFSPDGDRIVSASGDGRVVLWDVETRAQDWSTPGHWDDNVPSGKKTEPALCVDFSSDGKHVASGGGDTKVRLWNAETGEQVGPPLEGHTAFVASLDFSPDGQLLATCGWDGRIFLWDVTKQGAGNPRPLLGHRGMVKSVAFSPDGKTLVSAGEDSTIRSWSTLTSGQIRILRGHTDAVQSVAYSPDGQSLVSASRKKVKLWQATPPPSEDVFTEHSGWVESLALSPDGKTLVTIDYHTLALKLWDVPSRSFSGDLRGHTDIPRDVAFSPDGQFLASRGNDKTVRLWDLSKHKEIKVYECDLQIDEVSFSSDGTFLRTLSGGRLKSRSIASGREIELFRGDTRFIEHAAFSPDDGLLAAHYKDGKVSVWDTDDWTEVFKWKQEGIRSLIFSSDGHMIAAGGDGHLVLFDVAKGEIFQQIQGHDIVSISFTPDSRTLATASWDSTLRLWNVATGRIALRLQHQGPVTDVALSNDGRLMVTCGADATARLWPAASLSEADVSSRTR